jgi:hypothetical protein
VTWQRVIVVFSKMYHEDGIVTGTDSRCYCERWVRQPAVEPCRAAPRALELTAASEPGSELQPADALRRPRVGG